jgi:hypothetical protein
MTAFALTETQRAFADQVRETWSPARRWPIRRLLALIAGILVTRRRCWPPWTACGTSSTTTRRWVR